MSNLTKSISLRVDPDDMTQVEAIASEEGSDASTIIRGLMKKFLRERKASSVAKPSRVAPQPSAQPDEFAAVNATRAQWQLRFKNAGMSAAKKKIEKFACYKADVPDPKQLAVAQWESVFNIMDKIESQFGFDDLVAHIAREDYARKESEESAA